MYLFPRVVVIVLHVVVALSLFDSALSLSPYLPTVSMVIVCVCLLSRRGPLIYTYVRKRIADGAVWLILQPLPVAK